MGANNLILQLRTSGFSVSAANSRLRIAPADKLTEELKQTIQQSKEEILSQLQQEAQQEARRQNALALLQEDTSTQRVVLTDTSSDAQHIILTVAIRSVAAFEMLISKANYDPFRVLELIERHGTQATH